MFIPQLKVSSETLLYTYGVYLHAKLKAGPLTGDLVATLEKAQQALSDVHDREFSARIDLTLARAARDEEDFTMDRLLSHFELAVLTEVERDRSNPIYARLFPKPMSVVARMSPTRELDRVKRIEAVLAGAAEAAALTKWMPKLAEQRAKLETAFVAWQTVRHHVAEVRTSEALEKKRWLGTYVTIHGDLQTIFPTDRKKVESFFRPGPQTDRPKAVSAADETKIMERPIAQGEAPAA